MQVPPCFGRALYWQIQRLRGRSDLARRLGCLEKSQWSSPAELRALQLEKLARLLRHAQATVPYYRRIMRERGFDAARFTGPEDLERLPLLTRADLLRYQAELFSSKADRRHLTESHSSGSTGVRAVFWQDTDFEMWARAHQLRTYSWCGEWVLGEPFLLVWGSPVYWRLRNSLHQLEALASNRREWNAFQLGGDRLEQLLALVQRIRPVLISGYSTVLYLLARLAQVRGIAFPWLRAVQPTAEPLPDWMRAEFEAGFGCEVFDKYGSRETNIVAHETVHHDALAIQAENVFVEFLGPNDRPVQVGETGRLVLTPLNSFAMPLIRYETSDIAAPLPGTDSSGRGFPTMSHVAGRQQDVLRRPDGGAVHPQLFSNIFRLYEEIWWFQVVQREPARLTVRIYAPQGLPRRRQEQLAKLIAHHAGYPFELMFEILEQMPASTTGKFRLCVCELPDVGTADRAFSG